MSGYSPYQQPPAPPRRRSRALSLVLVLIVLVVAGGVVYFLVGNGRGNQTPASTGSGPVDSDKMNATIGKTCDLIAAKLLAKHVPGFKKAPDPNSVVTGSTTAMGRCAWNSPGEYPQRTVYLEIEGYKDMGDHPGVGDAQLRFEEENRVDQSKAGKTLTEYGKDTYSALEKVPGIGDDAYAIAHSLTGSRAKASTAYIVFHTGPYFARVTFKGYDLRKGGDDSIPADRNLLPDAKTFAVSQTLAKAVAAGLATS